MTTDEQLDELIEVCEAAEEKRGRGSDFPPYQYVPSQEEYDFWRVADRTLVAKMARLIKAQDRALRLALSALLACDGYICNVPQPAEAGDDAQDLFDRTRVALPIVEKTRSAYNNLFQEGEQWE